MVRVNMCLTNGGMKIRVLGYTPEKFTVAHGALLGLISINYNGNELSQLY